MRQAHFLMKVCLNLRTRPVLPVDHVPVCTQLTAMNCLTEVLGMGLRGNGTIPAVYSERIRLAKHAGMKVMEMWEKNIRPRDIMTKECNPECADSRYGTGMLYQQYAASSGNRT